MVGDVLVNEIGEDFDYVVMAVSPVSDFDGGVASWSYTAELTDSTGQGGFVEVPAGGDGDGDGTGCADCGSSMGGGSAGWAALLLLPWMRRRRG